MLSHRIAVRHGELALHLSEHRRLISQWFASPVQAFDRIPIRPLSAEHECTMFLNRVELQGLVLRKVTGGLWHLTHPERFGSELAVVFRRYIAGAIGLRFRCCT
jgi:hypothetical protein